MDEFGQDATPGWMQLENNAAAQRQKQMQQDQQRTAFMEAMARQQQQAQRQPRMTQANLMQLLGAAQQRQSPFMNMDQMTNPMWERPVLRPESGYAPTPLGVV